MQQNVVARPVVVELTEEEAEMVEAALWPNIHIASIREAYTRIQEARRRLRVEVEEASDV